MADIHKTKIAYLSTEQKLLEKMKNIEQDPMRAILASKNFIELEKEFNEKLKNQMLEILNSFTPKQQ